MPPVSSTQNASVALGSRVGQPASTLTEISDPTYPSLYQINTRVWLTDLSRSIGRAATLDDIPDAELDRVAEMGFDWVWFLSVWQTGSLGRQVSLTNPEWREEFRHTLPDLSDADIGGFGTCLWLLVRAPPSKNRPAL